MKSALILAFLFIMNFNAMAQANDCDFYIQRSESNKKSGHSLYPLNFSVSESIEVLITLNDKGKPGNIEIVLDFNDSSGLPVEIGSILSIKFIDQTVYSVIANSRKVKSSMVYFTLSDASSRTSTTSHASQDDKFLADKLSKVAIRELEITVDDKLSKIPIAETKSAILKATIRCLLNPGW